MTGSAGTPSTTTKPATSQPDKASAATTETARPSAEKVLETGTEEVGAPTPAARSPVSPATGTGTGTMSGSSGIGGVVEPSLPPRSSAPLTTSSPAASSSGSDAGIRSGSVASQYQRRSDQANEIAERARLNAMRAGNYARDQGRRGLSTAESFVRENPTASLLGALAAGLVLGALLARGTQGSSYRTRDQDFDDYDDEEAYTRDYYYD
ncbi:hypothetical protein JL100_035815 (plasmid) [Skermanella mucosa]|uniref:DUF883 family protein n=1 Tax=Skermanella mucosa TaxID=1789672 RepID=UPI00192A7E46|nr:hypothetical protein [Skermanella mucosa]UEM25151.1 hypothetical protein JL100_035815 [Skermanella mucosa]